MIIREQILSAIVTLLQTNTHAPVYRSRVTPIARNEAPAIVVEPVTDRQNQNTLSQLRDELTVRVSVIVRGLVPDSVADPIVKELHSKIMADTSLGGLCYELLPSGTGFELLETDSNSGIVSLDFIIQYRTDLQNLAT